MIAGMGLSRLLLLAVFAYVVLDLGCPSIPGAFSFDPADSVDAVSAYRIRPPASPRVVHVAVVTTTVRLSADTGRDVAAHRGEPPAIGWRRHAVGNRAGAADPRPAVDDD
jgi:hypothetical protein